MYLAVQMRFWCPYRYSVLPKASGKKFQKEMADRIRRRHAGGSGVIYCFSRDECERLADELCSAHRISAAAYHAGMNANDRNDVRDTHGGSHPSMGSGCARRVYGLWLSRGCCLCWLRPPRVGLCHLAMSPMHKCR